LAQVGVVADVHGNFVALAQVMARHPEVRAWLCVGDVASRTGAYPTPASPLYFVKGNNEDFARLEAFQAGRDHVDHLHYIPNGTARQVGPLRVAGLGGTYAPTWYDTPAAALPSARPKRRAPGAPAGTLGSTDDKRRHFVREEVEAAAALGPVDVLLTHEGPDPFWVTLPAAAGRARRNVGKRVITELLTRLRPRLHLFGHHHVAATLDVDGIPSHCVDRVNRAYLLLDVATLSIEARATEEDVR
jgi:hypothetical protein